MIVQRNTRIGVLQHAVVDFIDTTLDGLHQSATPDDGIKLRLDANALILDINTSRAGAVLPRLSKFREGHASEDIDTLACG
jgi:hypothetical protein